MTMPTPNELYMQLLPPAMSAYAAKTADMTSAKQMAHAVASETVAECMRLGLVGGGPADGGYRQAPPVPAVGVPGVPQFAPQGAPQGQGAAPLVPAGSPHQAAQHFNHPGPPVGPGNIMPKPYATDGGAGVVPPPGGQYVPPEQAGVMASVSQAPNPQGFSALGTNGVINQPDQKPNGKEVVVNPSNQPVIPAVGGASTTFVPEKIVR